MAKYIIVIVLCALICAAFTPYFRKKRELSLKMKQEDWDRRFSDPQYEGWFRRDTLLETAGYKSRVLGFVAALLITMVYLTQPIEMVIRTDYMIMWAASVGVSTLCAWFGGQILSTVVTLFLVLCF